MLKQFYHRNRTVLLGVGTVLSILSAAAAALFYLSIRWLMATWSELTVDEILYHLAAPLTGTGGNMIHSYLLHCGLPAFLVAILSGFLFLLLRRRRKGYMRLLVLTLAAAVAVVSYTVADVWDSLDLGNYIQSQFQQSDFIDNNFVDAGEVKIQFPEKKRNLIYIFMESTEVTFTDTKNGGAFPQNLLPEMTALAQENEDFSGSDPKLNGGFAMPGATWTMGAMFAQTSGIPLKISIDQNAMDTQKSFFPAVTTLGDLLQEQGYNQTLMLGSVGYFGGRELYFKTHGGYDVEDYSYMKKAGKFRANYWVNWGYEDRKLYSYAREKLKELSQEDQPFNLTLLTVDTHFPDGYVCPECPSLYPDNQYANVFACASRQLADFVAWVQQQDFYENTTIVVCGDHPTMDHDFCEEVDPDYERTVYTAYINAAASPVLNSRRDYTTFDAFPTTLAALGADIEGNRLGLGTNLFSDRPTLSEEYGRQYESNEIEKKSALMLELGNIDQEAAFESKEAKELEEK